MMSILASLMAGAGVGLSVAAPIGPMSMLCVQRTLATGLYAGLVTGLGVATVHMAYGALAVMGNSELGWILREPALSTLISGLVLLWFSVRVLRRAPILVASDNKSPSLATAYCGAVCLGFLNPITPMLFLATVPVVLGRAPAAAPEIVCGVFLGSLGWWFFLTGSVSVLRRRLTTEILGMVNKVVALTLAVLSITLMAKGYSALG